MPLPNQLLLDAVNGQRLWFRAKKTRPIWVRRLEQPETIVTLEGPETVPAGTYLCRGEHGDVWPQAEGRLFAKYDVAAQRDAQGWQQAVPKPDSQGVLAAAIPHAFQVHAAWGVLQGKPHDYLVKNYEDRDEPYPGDLWIVAQHLFDATYERVPSSTDGTGGD